MKSCVAIFIEIGIFDSLLNEWNKNGVGVVNLFEITILLTESVRVSICSMKHRFTQPEIFKYSG